MIQFDYPWLWLLLPLPLLAYRWLPTYRPPHRKLRVPFTVAFKGRVEQRASPLTAGISRAGLALRGMIWALLLTAAARPAYLEPPITHIEPRRDLILAIDLSQSMSEPDVTASDGADTTRLDAVKRAASQFINRRTNDRIGLVGFGDRAFPLAPPSREHDSLQQILAMTESGMAGANTALGDAIGVTLKLLEQSDRPDKLLILLTDGNDNRSRLDPLQAARIANNRGLTVHTIGFGRTDTGTDEAVDAPTLERIAGITGGQSFLATDRTALERVYRTIDAVTPHNAEELRARPRRELFWIPVLMASGLLLLQVLAGLMPSLGQRPARWREVERHEP
ncbi:VWA domain-containing protein [Marinobacter sp. F4206]|uniref:VWA domain-containing protein n=1 Tax=Marinobacter sp. F4206 TaxID=2861777 RepID=UPI001C5EB090|nr:VWA domain-containing protein [Marinobacter sp. F4206]MBW4935390.1 VWA domain-containing protein [Marinobacter sp. F4206]